MLRLLFIIILSFFLSFADAYAKSDLYPFVAQITADNVNVRSGQSANFDSLGLLSKGDKLVVLAKKYSWYKVQLPPNFKLYLSEQFVFLRPDGKADILGNRINVRARGNATATVMTQVSKGDVIEVIDKKDGWYAIKPVDGVYGWVNDSFLKFESKAVDSYIVKPLLSPDEKEQIVRQKKEAEERKRKAELLKIKKEAERRKVSIRGVIEKMDENYGNRGAYKVVTNNQLTYILDEHEHLLTNFAHQKVLIEGKITKFPNTNSPYPVITINKLQLIL